MRSSSLLVCKPLALSLVVGLCLLLAPGGSGVAQDDGIAVLKVTTQAVVLDVTVVDKKGHLVNSLTRDQFTVLEDTVPQRIRSFEAPAEHKMPAETAGKLVVNSSADLKKIGNAPTTVLVLDEMNTAFTDMAYSRYCINKYLDAQPAIMPQPTILLAVTDDRFEVIRDYTQDREEIRKAVKKHFPELPAKMMRSGANGTVAAERMSTTLGSLYQIAKSSTGTPGRKSIIWIGAGFPSFDLMQEPPKTADALVGAMRRLTQTLLESHVTLFTIDPTVNLSNFPPMETPEDLQEAEDLNNGEPFADHVKFSTLAPATGGVALFSRNDIEKEVATTIEQGSNYYTLSYSPTNKITDPDAYRHIRIVLKDPTLQAITRDGYYSRVSDSPNPFAEQHPSAEAQVAQLKMDLTTAAFSDIVFTGISINVNHADASHFKLGIPAGDLNWKDNGDGSHQAEISAIVVAFSPKRKVLAHYGTELLAKTTGNPAKAGSQLAGFAITFEMPKGTSRLRFVVRDAVSGKLGTSEIAGSDIP